MCRSRVGAVLYLSALLFGSLSATAASASTFYRSQFSYSTSGPDSNQLSSSKTITLEYKPIQADSAMSRVKIITSQDLQNMAAQNVSDALRFTLNTQLTQDPSLGTTTNIMGLSGDNIKILINGQPVTGRQNGNIDLSQLPLVSIDHIEIIEGPTSLVWGSNAMGATINIITKTPADRKWSISSKLYHDRTANTNISLYATLPTPVGNFSLSGFRNFFDGWTPSEAYQPWDIYKPADSARFQLWKPKELIGASVGYNLPKFHNLTIASDYSHEFLLIRGHPLAPYGEFARDQSFTSQRLNSRASTSTAWKKHFVFTNSISHSLFYRTKQTNITDLTQISQRPSLLLGDFDTSSYHHINARSTIKFLKDSSKWNAEAGLDANYEYARTERLNISANPYILSLASYASATYAATPSLKFKLGARAEYNSRTLVPVTPATYIWYKLDSKTTIKAQWAYGYRTPSVKELYFFFVDINHNIIGNPKLQSESGHYASLSSIHRIRSHSKLELTFSHTNLQNRISLAQLNDLEYSYINLETFKNYIAQANYQLSTKHFQASLGLLGSLAYTSILATEQQPINWEANSQWLVSISKGWQANFFIKYQGPALAYFASADNQSELTLRRAQAYTMADCSLQWRSELLVLALGVKNIANVQAIANTLTTPAAHTSGGASLIANGINPFFSLEYIFSKSLPRKRPN